MRRAEAAAAAPAKINLALRVGRRRADGYHPLNTLFHAVDLREQVTVEAAADSCDELAVAGPWAAAVPLDSSNLALQAAALLRRTHGRPGAPQPGRSSAATIARGDGPDNGRLELPAPAPRATPPLATDDDGLGPVRLTIHKAIPVAGGLAGGSADAAAALVALNRFWGLGLSRARLIELAAELGSDVPFAVAGGNAIGTGRGETLTPVASRGAFEWVLVTSSAGLSTPQVFAHFDALEPGAVPGLATASGPGPAVRPGAGGPPPIPAALLAGLTAGDPAAVGANLVNDLQPAALSLRPELADVIGAALDAGALGAIVSGSGPTIACLAAAPESAHALATALHSRLTTLNPAPTILRATGPAPPAQFRQSVSFSCQVDRDPPYASKTS